MDDQSREVYAVRHARYVEEARRESQIEELEVLTPSAASTLFSISKSAVRGAVQAGHVKVPFSLTAEAGEGTRMLSLTSATNYWKRKLPPDAEETLERWRRDCVNIAIPYGPEANPTYRTYNVLHPTRLVSVDDAQGLNS